MPRFFAIALGDHCILRRITPVPHTIPAHYGPLRERPRFPDMCASSGAVAAHTATVVPVAGVLRNWRI
jgi:hypothetical protein